MMLGCLVMRSSETSALAAPASASAQSAATVSSEASAAFVLIIRAVIWISLAENNARLQQHRWKVPSFLAPALSPFTVARQCVRVGRIGARQRPPSGDLAEHEFLERFLLVRVAAHLFGQVLRYHDSSLAVTDQDVAGKHGHAAARDWQVDIDRVMADEIERRAAAGAIDRKVHQADGLAVAQTSVGHDSCSAAHLQPGQQDVAARRGPRLASAVHDQYLSGRHRLHRFALRMLGIVESAYQIEILS